MKVLITGGGQLAWELAQTVPATVELIAAPRAVLDITDASACETLLQQHQPKWVINTAAYTAVDRAEQEKEKAFFVNEQGAANIAQACNNIGDRKSTRLNSSHVAISYAVFCLKKKKKE